MRELASGFGSAAYETPGGVVFRVARTTEAAAGHALEARALPALAPALPVPTPGPLYRLPPSEPLAFGAVGHAKLAGEPLVPERASAAIAEDVAAFLRALHSIPCDDARAVGVRPSRPWRERVAALRDVLPALRKRLAPDERARLEAWRREALDDAAMVAPDALIHGDAWYENFLGSGTPPRLVGVLDWGGIALGDPAEDLAPQFYLGAAFAQAVLREYGADADLRHRVRRYRVLREFEGLRWALEQRDDAELDDAVEKLRRSSISAA